MIKIIAQEHAYKFGDRSWKCTRRLGWHHLPRDSHWGNYYVTSKKKSPVAGHPSRRWKFTVRCLYWCHLTRESNEGNFSVWRGIGQELKKESYEYLNWEQNR